MFSPIINLDLPASTITDLQKKGFYYVEDLLNDPENLEKMNLKKSEIEKKLKFPDEVALDVWQNESQRESIMICCSELDAVLENGVQCGTITELSGAPFTGKTQICMQLCISVQLKKLHGGLSGRAIYIDTRSGTSLIRFKDFIRGCNNYHKLNLKEDEILNNIDICTPNSLKEFMKIIENLESELKKIKYDKRVRLVIVDSLSMPILCSIDEPKKRPHYYSKVLHELHRLTTTHDVAIVITNELVIQLDKDNKTNYAAAGGQHVADYSYIKLELTRISSNTFATRVVKSSVMPELSVTFMIAEDGIRNVS